MAKDYGPRLLLERELAYRMMGPNTRGKPSKAHHTKARQHYQWMADTGHTVYQGNKLAFEAGEKFPPFPVAWEND